MGSELMAATMGHKVDRINMLTIITHHQTELIAILTSLQTHKTRLETASLFHKTIDNRIQQVKDQDPKDQQTKVCHLEHIKVPELP